MSWVSVGTFLSADSLYCFMWLSYVDHSQIPLGENRLYYDMISGRKESLTTVWMMLLFPCAWSCIGLNMAWRSMILLSPRGYVVTFQSRARKPFRFLSSVLLLFFFLPFFVAVFSQRTGSSNGSKEPRMFLGLILVKHQCIIMWYCWLQVKKDSVSKLFLHKLPNFLTVTDLQTLFTAEFPCEIQVGSIHHLSHVLDKWCSLLSILHGLSQGLDFVLLIRGI